MADQLFNPLTDDELKALAPQLAQDPELLNKLTPDERRRLSRYPVESPGIGSRVVQAVKEHPAQAGALALGVPMSIATAGMGVLPAAALVGLAGAGGAGLGLSADQIANRDTQPAPTVGGNVKEMVKQGAGQAAGEVGGRAVSAGLESVGKGIYRGILKPSLAANKIGKADQIVNTLIDEAIPISKGGAEKASGVISDLHGEVQRILDQSPGTVDLHDVADQVRQFAKAKYYRPGAPTEDFAAAMKVADTIDAHPALNLPGGGASTVRSVGEANKAKESLYTAIGDTAYGTESGAATTARKVGASATKAAIEGVEPAVAGLNARQSKLIGAAQALNRALGREGNRSAVMGVPTILSGALGAGDYARTGDPYQSAVLALGARFALQPAVLSRAAIVASQLGARSGAAPEVVAQAAITALLTPDRSPE